MSRFKIIFVVCVFCFTACLKKNSTSTPNAQERIFSHGTVLRSQGQPTYIFHWTNEKEALTDTQGYLRGAASKAVENLKSMTFGQWTAGPAIHFYADPFFAQQDQKYLVVAQLHQNTDMTFTAYQDSKMILSSARALLYRFGSVFADFPYSLAVRDLSVLDFGSLQAIDASCGTQKNSSRTGWLANVENYFQAQCVSAPAKTKDEFLTLTAEEKLLDEKYNVKKIPTSTRIPDGSSIKRNPDVVLTYFIFEKHFNAQTQTMALLDDFKVDWSRIDTKKHCPGEQFSNESCSKRILTLISAFIESGDFAASPAVYSEALFDIGFFKTPSVANTADVLMKNIKARLCEERTEVCKDIDAHHATFVTILEKRDAADRQYRNFMNERIAKSSEETNKILAPMKTSSLTTIVAL